VSLLRGMLVLDLATERRAFVVGTGDELPDGWLDGSFVLLDEYGCEPDEGSWWARTDLVEVLEDA
jgi:hypothetical protein